MDSYLLSDLSDSSHTRDGIRTKIAEENGPAYPPISMNTPTKIATAIVNIRTNVEYTMWSRSGYENKSSTLPNSSFTTTQFGITFNRTTNNISENTIIYCHG